MQSKDISLYIKLGLDIDSYLANSNNLNLNYPGRYDWMDGLRYNALLKSISVMQGDGM